MIKDIHKEKSKAHTNREKCRKKIETQRLIKL